MMARVQLIGEGALTMEDFTMEQLTQKEPHVTKLRIKSPKGYEGGGGVLYLGLAYDSATGRGGGGSGGSGGGGSSSSNGAIGVSGGPANSPAAVGVPSGVLLTNPARNGSTVPSGGGVYAGARSATGAGGGGGALPPLPEMREEEWGSAAGSMMGGSMLRTPGPDGDAGAFSVVRAHMHGMHARRVHQLTGDRRSTTACSLSIEH